MLREVNGMNWENNFLSSKQINMLKEASYGVREKSIMNTYKILNVTRGTKVETVKELQAAIKVAKDGCLVRFIPKEDIKEAYEIKTDKQIVVELLGKHSEKIIVNMIKGSIINHGIITGLLVIDNINNGTFLNNGIINNIKVSDKASTSIINNKSGKLDKVIIGEDTRVHIHGDIQQVGIEGKKSKVEIDGDVKTFKLEEKCTVLNEVKQNDDIEDLDVKNKILRGEEVLKLIHDKIIKLPFEEFIDKNNRLNYVKKYVKSLVRDVDIKVAVTKTFKEDVYNIKLKLNPAEVEKKIKVKFTTSPEVKGISFKKMGKLWWSEESIEISLTDDIVINNENDLKKAFHIYETRKKIHINNIKAEKNKIILYLNSSVTNPKKLKLYYIGENENIIQNKDKNILRDFTRKIG